MSVNINIYRHLSKKNYKRSFADDSCEKPSSNFSYIGFNLKNSLLSNLEIRKAIAYGVDIEKIIKYILKNQAIKATGLISPLSWAYDPNVELYEYNPTLARELILKFRSGK